MTQDDCNNSQSDIILGDRSLYVQSESSNESYEQVYLQGTVEKTIWDAAVTSADDALVLVQWLNSKLP
jgi:hypothetical protein